MLIYSLKNYMAKLRGKFWQYLPEDLLLMIIAKLPTRIQARMKVVCKEWNQLLSSTHHLSKFNPNMPVSSSSAFSITFQKFMCEGPESSWIIPEPDSWILEGKKAELYKVPSFSFDCMELACCNSIYCNFRRESDGESDGHVSFCLYNPGTRTSRQLPCTSYYTGSFWNFSAMAVDSSARRCTILIGEYECDGNIKVEIYDSESNAWTTLDMKEDHSIQPSGKGVYSRGRFYWLNTFCDEFSYGGIVEFNIEERRWTEVPSPHPLSCSSTKYPPIFEEELNTDSTESSLISWELVGSDGILVLANKTLRRMWKLEQTLLGKHEWSSITISLPKVVHGVAVNSAEWTLIIGTKILIYNEKKRLVKKIGLSKLDPQLPEYIFKHGRETAIFVSAFESNNVWWP